jgi:hypothetical protein
MIFYYNESQETSMLVFNIFDGVEAPEQSLYVMFTGWYANTNLRNLIFDSEHGCRNVDCYYNNGKPIIVSMNDIVDFINTHDYKEIKVG